MQVPGSLGRLWLACQAGRGLTLGRAPAGGDWLHCLCKGGPMLIREVDFIISHRVVV